MTLGDRSGIAIVEVCGELDIHTAPQLEAVAIPAVTPGSWVIIDGKALEFTDSTGLSLFVKVHKRAVDAGGRLDLVLNPKVTRVVELAGLMGILNVHDSLDDAIQAG
ncbi:MAG: STAS domain-containing protein [Actinomycetales bacterium]|nr:STAS domain-containing protein [Actinomycetales bacterium]